MKQTIIQMYVKLAIYMIVDNIQFLRGKLLRGTYPIHFVEIMTKQYSTA